MKDLLSLIKERLLANESLVLVTILESSGSTPRKAGARMLAGKEAGAAVRLWGSIGGGLPEHLALEEAASLLKSGGTSVKKYVLNSGEAAEAGAVCGGEMSVQFWYLDSGETGILEAVEKELSRVSESLVCVFGGGHVAQELVPLLLHLDFRCVVFDDRGEFACAELFPGAERVILGDFTRIGEYISLSERDFAVIVTRGHLWDLEALAFALKSPAHYIGVIGSKSKHEYVRKQLLERGFPPEAINAPRVHAPIGMDIKSETPAEIAVSIAGELILNRAASGQRS